jgi:FkbM family methyltransferase
MCAIPLNEDVDRRVRLADGTFLVYRLNRADIWAIHEIYVDREYDLPPDESPKVIIDLGANIGLASLWFAKKFKAFLLAVEPSAENARVARRNFIENDLQGEVIEAAVGSTDGTGVFLRGPGATCGRVDFKEEFDSAGRKREHAVDVRVVSMVSILERLPRGSRVDLLKVDIEGGEEELLRGDTAWLHRVDRIIIEFHPDLIDYLPAVAKLESAGFVRRKQTNLAHTSVEMFSRFAVYTNDATQAEGEPDFKSGQK